MCATLLSKRVRFYSTVDLVNLLEREKHDGKAGRIAQALLRMDLVILDELGADDEVGVAGKLEWSRRAIDSVSVRALDAGHWRERDQPAAAGTDRRSI